MSSTEIEPRVIAADSPIDERCPDYMTAGEYIDNSKRLNKDLGLITVQAVYDDMLDSESISTDIEISGSSPEVVAFMIGELMEGDESKTRALNWAYLAMYQRHWSYFGSMDYEDSLPLLEYADRFAAATGQTHIHSSVNGSYDGLEWDGVSYDLGFLKDYDGRTYDTKASDGDPRHLSLILGGQPELLKQEANINTALAKCFSSGIKFNFLSIGSDKAPFAA